MTSKDDKGKAKPSDDFLSGGGEMGDLMRSFDFSTTPLGPTGNNGQAMLKARALLLLTKEAAVNELYRRMREALVMHVGSGSACQ